MRVEGNYRLVAPFYDLLDRPFERWIYAKMREKWISPLRDCKILEIGVGTGKNLPYYHDSNQVIGLDTSPSMLRHAQTRQASTDAEVILATINDYSSLPRNSFDVVVATFVLYTMADATQLVSQIKRVLKQSGKLLIFEYRRPTTNLLYKLMVAITPLSHFLYGVDFRTLETPRLLDGWKVINYHEQIPQLVYGGLFSPPRNRK